MLKTSMVVGWLLILLFGAAGFLLLFWFWYSRNSDSKAAEWLRKYLFFLPAPEHFRPKETLEHERAVSRAIAMQDLSKAEQLQRVAVGQFITYMGSNLRVLATIALTELQQFGSSRTWQSTGRHFRLIQLSGDILLVHMPFGEGEFLHWFKMDARSARGMTEFLGGSSGPARRFAASDQQADVRFDWSGRWRMVDIGTFDFSVSGSGFLSNRGRCRHVMAKEVGGDRWFLFFDLMEGSGSDALWIGEQFDPEVVVEDVL
jgi:hypothetical protein